MSSARYLCSQLIRLAIMDADMAGAQPDDQWVNLEEIWADGAMLECDSEVALGVSATIFADEISFSGRITAVELHEFGCQVEITFSPANRWSIEKWRPEHAFDPNTLEL